MTTLTIAEAPENHTIKMIELALRNDPYQSRVSRDSLLLTQPSTGKKVFLKEYCEDIAGDSRMGIRCKDGIVIISRLESPLGVVFISLQKITLDGKLVTKGEGNGIRTLDR